MINQNIRHEVRLMSRNYWFLALALVLMVLCFYAGYNGSKHFEQRQSDQEKAIESQRIKEQHVLDVANALSKGEDHPNAYRLSPMNLSIATGRLATMTATDMSKIAIGQSDLYTHQVSISSREDFATKSFNELNNPIQLLFGKFDLTFVFAYLIPLLIIAFTYNLRTEELETGRLKLLASNPIRINTWLLQRFVIRFCALAIILTLVLAILVLLIGIELRYELFAFCLLSYAYLAFWFGVAYLVNVLGYSSARNAITLLSLWVLLVLIVPTVINQAANTIYPMPSRVALLNEIRSTKKELSKEQDKVLDEYLRNHPELIRNEEQNAFGYWQGFYASQEMAEKALFPLIDKFDRQLEKQQKWVKLWSYLSPAVLFQEGATELAGTSSLDYNQFKTQVKSFGVDWRSYFLPYVFDNKMLTLADLENLPTFENRPALNKASTLISVIILFALSLFMGLGGVLLEGKKQLLQPG